MPKGASGRIVIEVGEAFKRRLYSVLAAQGLTLKDWFVRTAAEHIDQYEQPSLLPETKAVSSGDRKP